MEYRCCFCRENFKYDSPDALMFNKSKNLFPQPLLPLSTERHVCSNVCFQKKEKKKLQELKSYKKIITYNPKTEEKSMLYIKNCPF